MTSLCILTPDAGYHEDWQLPAGHYRSLFGDELAFRPWTDPGDLTHFGLVLPLLAWGYQRQPERWFQALDLWDANAIPFANDLATLRWNTDKAYLLDLADRAVAIVPTIVAHALDDGALDAARRALGADAIVVKPVISGGADGTYRLGEADRIPADVAGRRMLIQPLVASIATQGEYSLFYFAGEFSHAIVKRPAQGDFRVQEQFGGCEEPVAPPPAALTLARKALAAAPSLPLYARVDMVIGPDGAFLLMELELIEPSLFLEHAADGGGGFAAALSARLSRS
jgi:glutathione synthase/RimK-type ligase-like ATP-grasp enzyme